MSNPKNWTKPTIEVSAVKLAEYYHFARTDAGPAQHQS